jgi:hypothetical protein
MRTPVTPFLLSACAWVVAGVAFTACGDGNSGSLPDAAQPDAPLVGPHLDAAPSEAPAQPDAPVVGPNLDAAPSEVPVVKPRLDGASLDTSVVPPAVDYCTSKPVQASVTNVSGTWVVRTIGAIVVNAPIIGVVHQQIVLTLLVDVSQQGTNLVADGRYCNRQQKSDPGALTQVIIPDAWAHTETPLQRPGTFAVASDGAPVVIFTTMAETMGAVLTSPGTEPLPTAADDPRVIDQDNDGNPGITVSLTGLGISGQLYAVQRQITSFAGIPVSQNRIEGAVTFSTEQNVLDSNPPSLATLYAQAGQSGADPTVCSSTFTMIKVADAADGGAVTCAWVRANEAALIGP